MNNITTKKSGKPGSELSIGQYVKYEPSGGSATYPCTTPHNGWGDQTISRENLNWRILSVDGDSVKIISDINSTNVQYAGAEGYNNVVKDLNNMCGTLYSHGTTKARSVSLDDFSNKSQEYTAGQYSATCPNIYPQEKMAGGNLGQSEQIQWITGTTSTNKMGTNYWTGSLQDTDPLYSSTNYFVASRCVTYISNRDYRFYMQYASTNLHYFNLTSFLVDSFGTYVPSARIRAVVSLPSDVTFGEEQGIVEDPYTINWNDGSGSEGGGGGEPTPSQSASDLKIGQYINYIPDSETTTYESLEEHNGSGLQKIDRETLYWRVLDIGNEANGLDEGTVKIISNPTTKEVTYSGAEGYNNAVKDLNDMCESLYSHGDTKARSVNLEDFTTSSFKSNFSQTTTAYTADSPYNNFPTIYQDEYNDLGQSTQNQWYSGTYNGAVFKCNNWSGSIPSNSPLYSYSNGYWLSSRCVRNGSSGSKRTTYFDLLYANWSLNTSGVFYSYPTTSSQSHTIRAVVILPASCTFGIGDIGDPITINW